MAETQKLTAQQRALLFGASTRQHFQMLSTMEASGGAQTLSTRIPKARLLQAVRLLVETKVNVKHASSTSIALTPMSVYKILRRVSLDFNNGFAPITTSAYEMALLNTLKPNPEIVLPSTDGTTLCKAPTSLTASVAGTDNTFSFMLELPLTLNERDPVGLFLAQNAETNIDLTLDVGNGGEIINNASGYTVSVASCKITPMTTTFSVPNDPRAFPDLSVLKVCDTRTETFSGSGQNHIKLPIGMIYRKMILILTDDSGNPLKPEDITSNLELVLNTADIPYSISPDMLRAVNKTQNGISMPDGVYFFDFSYQGYCNYGGSRDYIDTETISEFTLRFTSAKSGKCAIVSEKLARLR